MNKLAEKIFKNADKFTVQSKEISYSCKGVVTRLKGSEVYENDRTAAGVFVCPLYLFMGDGTELVRGDVLSGDQGKFTVLSAEIISAFGKTFCVRAVLEKTEELSEII